MKWIDTREQLPPRADSFLCCEAYDGSEPDVYVADFTGEDFYVYINQAIKVFPSHWMEVPELPDPVPEDDDEPEDEFDEQEYAIYCLDDIEDALDMAREQRNR